MLAHGRALKVEARKPLFLDIAAKALHRGERARALCVLLEGLRRRTDVMADAPEAMALTLAKSTPSLGFEEEIVGFMATCQVRDLPGLYLSALRDGDARPDLVEQVQAACGLEEIESSSLDEPSAVAHGAESDAEQGSGASTPGAERSPSSYLPTHLEPGRTDNEEGECSQDEEAAAAAKAARARAPFSTGDQVQGQMRGRRDAWLKSRLEVDEKTLYRASTHAAETHRFSPRLGQAATVDALLAEVACSGHRAPMRRSVAHVPSLRWSRRLALAGLTLLSIVSAGAAFAYLFDVAPDLSQPSAWQQMHDEATPCSPAGLSKGVKAGLRAAIVEGLRPSMAARLVLIDRLLAKQMGRTPTPMGRIPGVRAEEPDAVLATVYDALARHERDGLSSKLELVEPASWEQVAGARPWAEGLLAAHAGDISGAVVGLGRAADEHALGAGAMLELADLALTTRDPGAVSAFLARADRFEHPFVEIAAELLTQGQFEAAPQLRLPAVASLSTLGGAHRGWYFAYVAEHAQARDDHEAAQAAILAGLAVAPRNASLLARAGLSRIRLGDVDQGAAALTAALPGIDRGRAREVRATAGRWLGEAGRPDLVLEVMQARESLSGARHPQTRSRDEVHAMVDALWSLGRLEEAETLLRGAGDGKDAQSLGQRLRIAERRGDVAAATALGARLARTHSYEAELAHLGRAARDAYHHEVLDEATRVSVAHPEKREALVLRAELMSVVGQGDLAASLVEQAWPDGPLAVRRDLLVALLRSRAGTLSEEALSRALEAEVTALELLTMQAEIAWRAGKVSLAKRWLDDVLAADPQYGRASGLLGLIDEDAEADRRIARLQAGRQGNLTLPGLELALASIMASQGDIEGAALAYEAAMWRPGDEPAGAKGYASLFASPKRKKAGLKRMRTLFESLPQIPQTRSLRGYVAYELGMLHGPTDGSYASAKYLKKARILLGEDVNILVALGRYFDARGYRKASRKLYAQIYEIDPEFPLPSGALDG